MGGIEPSSSRTRREPLELLMVFQQEQRLLQNRVQYDSGLGLSLGAAEVEQAIHDPGAAVDFLVDDLQILIHPGPLGRLQGVQPPADRGDAGADGRQRVVDLVHDAGGKLADGRQLFALHDLPLDPARLGHVLTDGDRRG